MKDIKEANKEAGQYWFSLGATRFFKSRIVTKTPIGGRFFITSEQFDNKSPRLYTIREVLENGHIRTIGDFQRYKTVTEARREIERLVNVNLQSKETNS